MRRRRSGSHKDALLEGEIKGTGLNGEDLHHPFYYVILIDFQYNNVT